VLVSVTAVNGGPLVQLTFHPVAGAGRYELEVQRDGSSSWMQLLNNNAVVLDVGQYVLRLRACNDIICGAFGNELSVVVTRAPLKSFVPFIGR
ncbi:MAG: hypothetical protein C0184_10775, partial [Chloroflexus aggregans]